MKKRSVFILLLAFIHVPFAFSTEYYFSNLGNDELNTGTSETSPFKTITKLNTLNLQPGDKVLFKRGDVFSGEIKAVDSGTKASPIIYTSYGSGPNPVISGTVKVSGWKKYSGNIYVADIPQAMGKITQLFAKGALMRLARYPNQGFLTIDSSFGKESVSSNSITQANGYWTGAKLVSRTERWVYENRPVKAHLNKTLFLTTPTEFEFKTGFGFYLTDKLSMLDIPGEWYHDATQNKLYFMPPQLEDPNTLNIQASVYNYGFNINYKNHISILNLSISCQGLDGIYIYGCKNISISSNNFSYNFRNGIWTGYQDGSDIRIVNNTFECIGNNGIDISRATSSIIQGNILKKIALIPGIGRTGFGIHAGAHSYIAYNILDSIGYNGIHCHNGDSVMYNQIQNACLTLDDGAGIYFFKSDHVVVKHNIIINLIGNGTATSKEYSTFAHGIYLDDSSSYCTIYNNTVVNGDYGIFVHNSFNNILEKNTLYNNRKSQLTLQNDRPYGKDLKQNVILENIFYSLHPDQYNLTLWNYRSSIKEFGSFDKNHYCNPYSDILIKSRNIPNAPTGTVYKNQTYTFESWKTVSGYDANSRHLQKYLGDYYNVTVNTQNLIPNSTFLKNKNYWYSWGSGGYSIYLDSTNSAMSDNALKSAFSSSGLNQSGKFATGDFPVSSGKYYQLSFKANSLKSATLDFDLTQNEHPYGSADIHKSFLIEKEPKNFNFIFKSNASFPNTRLSFYMTGYDTTLWIDDVSFAEVTVDTNGSTPLKKSPIFINTTSQTKRFSPLGRFEELNGTRIKRYINVAPFGSKILITTLASATNPYRSTQHEDQGFDTYETDAQIATIFNIPAEQGGSIYIQYPEGEALLNIGYSVKDMTGKEVLRGSCNSIGSDLIEIPTNDLGRGLFILTLQSGLKTHHTKIIIQ